MQPSLFILRKAADPEDSRTWRAIERLERGIARCDHIVDELLDYTRIGKLELRAIPVDEWLGALLDEQGIPPEIEVRRRLGLGDQLISLDPDRFRRAVINVYDNACQAMSPEDQGTPVGEDLSLTVSTRMEGDRLELEFADSGPGIPPDVLARIFEPLYSTKSFCGGFPGR